MKCKFLPLAFVFLFAGVHANAQQNWQKLTLPKTSELQANFRNPPAEYAETVTYGLTGTITQASVAADLDLIKKQGIRAVSIEGGYRMKSPYLSEGWFELVKMIVEELKKRDMRLWIIDEGKYPSGFAGGKFSQEAPELRMQGLVVSSRIPVTEGGSLNRQFDPSVISAIAINQAEKLTEPVPVVSGAINWTARKGNWEVVLVQHRFKTSVTRAANNPTGGKDTVNSLCDYLNPEATRKFLEFTHVQYKKHVGSEFGKTILGFRGDEPDYGFTPWTPDLDGIFIKKKGYDIRPYIASFFAPFASEKQKLAKADFWDVWSDLFRDNFFKVQADWCAENGLEYMVHLNHEDKMMDLAKSEGDFFKAMRYVQVPGVDAIWNQIWPGKVADFSKLASSAAHLYGRPRSLSETFAAYNPAPTVKEARWVINQQLVRGINLFEFMFWSSASPGRSSLPRGYLGDPAFQEVTAYANRASYLLANGKPAASIGLYLPTENMWMGDEEADKSTWKLAQQLLENQLDFDFVDQHAISTGLKLEKGAFLNSSGQQYKTIVVPSTHMLTDQVIARLQAFAKGGGKVLFAGQIPQMSANANFLTVKPITGFNLPSGELKADVLKESLNPDVKFAQAVPEIKYLHRHWQDAELYFFFNEGTEKKTVISNLTGSGKAEIWDAVTGTITPLMNPPARNGKISLPLELEGYESKFIVIRK